MVHFAGWNIAIFPMYIYFNGHLRYLKNKVRCYPYPELGYLLTDNHPLLIHRKKKLQPIAEQRAFTRQKVSYWNAKGQLSHCDSWPFIDRAYRIFIIKRLQHQEKAGWLSTSFTFTTSGIVQSDDTITKSVRAASSEWRVCRLS